MAKFQGGKLNEGVFPRLLEPSYRLYVPSVERLAELPLIVNGLDVAPMFRYRGVDATAAAWPAWGYGVNLTVSSTPVPTPNALSPYLGPNDVAVQLNNGGVYVAGADADHDMTTEDIVVEAVGKLTGLSGYVFSKTTDSAGNPGYTLLEPTATSLRFSITAAGGTKVSTSSPTLIANSWYHVLFFINRDENSTYGSACFVNSLMGAGVNSFTAAGSLTTTSRFTIGGRSGPSSPFLSGPLAYIAMYKAANWHQAGSAGIREWTAIAKERFAALHGTRPLYSIPLFQTSQQGRGNSSATYQRKVTAGVTSLHLMQPYTNRFEQVIANSGTVFTGRRVEYQTTNHCLQSQTFGTTWTATNASILATAVTVPSTDVLTTVTLSEGGAGTQHYLEQTVNCNAGAGLHCLSIYAKAGTRNWLALSLDGDVGYFNLTTGQVGTAPAGGSGIMNMGGGWYRCWVFKSLVGSPPGNKVVRIYLAEADADIDFAAAGSNPESMYLWHCQVERADGTGANTGDKYPSSPTVPSTTGAPTRSVDYSLVTLGRANLLKGSQTFAGSVYWSIIGSETIADNATTAPDGSATAASHKPSTTIATHRISQANVIVEPGYYTYSVYAQKGAWNYAIISNENIGSCWAAFNLNTGAIHSQQAGIISASITPVVGTSWYRCSITFLVTASAAHDLRLYVSDDGTQHSWSSPDGTTIGMYWWGAQLEYGTVATTYIPTTSVALATETGLSDTEGALFLRFCSPAHTSTTNYTLCTLAKNKTVTDYVNVVISSSSGNVASATASTGGADTGSVATSGTNYNDGNIHTVLVTWAHNLLRLYVDGVLKATDTVVDPPVSLNTIHHSTVSFSSPAPALVGDVQVFNTSDISKLKIVY